ncbi:MAG: hypothetical protein JWP97_3431, partial [Labilithrix sp.]|nr:hypothetical protein [Labilithrix sp.]
GAAAAAGAKLSVGLFAAGGAVGALATALGVVLAIFVIAPAASTTPATAARGAHVPAAAEPDPRLHAVERGAQRAVTPVRERAMPVDGDDGSAAPASITSKTAVVPRDPPSDLAEEARLVTAARAALVAGDAERALVLVQATRRLGARALEPEELGVEARALRALGRTDEAAATELVLRRRHPESALAR